MQLHGFVCGLIIIFCNLLPVSRVFGQTKDILFIRHGQSSFNQMMEQKRGLQKLKGLTVSRHRIKDANLTQTGIVEALQLRQTLLEHLNGADEKLRFIAESVLEPNDSVLLLTSNLRRAVNTGLLVLYGDDREKTGVTDNQSKIYPLYISSILQEWGVPYAIPDVRPYSKDFFKHDQLIDHSVKSSLGSFKGRLEQVLQIFPGDMQISPNGYLRKGTGNTRALNKKYKDFLENIVFSEHKDQRINLENKQTIVVFGHGRWLKGFVNYLKAATDPKMIIAPNASLTHMKIKKQAKGYSLVYRKICHRGQTYP